MIMNLKKCLLLSLSCVLFSCSDVSSEINSSYTYDESFSVHLSNLLDFNDTSITYQEDYKFNLECSYIVPENEEDNRIIVLEFSYKDVVIDNVRIIALPFSLTKENIPSSVSNIGYYDINYSLTNELDIENNQYKGIRIMYKTYSLDDDVKVSFYGDTEVESLSYMFYIDNKTIEEKTNNNLE